MLKLSKSKNIRVKNLTQIFLEDYCTLDIIQKASDLDTLTNFSTAAVSDIPLPDS